MIISAFNLFDFSIIIYFMIVAAVIDFTINISILKKVEADMYITNYRVYFNTIVKHHLRLWYTYFIVL